MGIPTEEESNGFGANDLSEKTMCIGEGINPCLIPHVTDQIIQYLLPDTKNLRQARLVCKDWSISASQALRKVTRARIGEHCSNVQKLSDFLSLAEQQGMNIVSVTNFTFCQDVFQIENESVFKKFMLIYHPFLESLTLWFDLKSSMSFDKSGFLFTTDPFQSDNFIFPKLKHIEWDDRRIVHSETFMNSGPQLLEWLISRCPNLESLSIHFESQDISPRFTNNGAIDVSNNYCETDELLQRIFSPKSPQTKLRHLRSLHLDVNINDKLLHILSEYFLHTKQLSSLTMCVRGSYFLPGSFENMLSSVNQHLEELRIVSLCDKSHCVIRFPESLPKLKLLEITGWNVNSGNIRVDSFSLAKNFPSLKTLVLDCWNENPEWWQFLGGIGTTNRDKQPIASVQELVLPEEIVNRAKISEILKVFPNLRKLDFPISSEEIEVLQIVFENCPELTDLTIRRSSTGWKKSKEIIDSVFTGIPPDICMKILRSNSLNCRFPVLSNKVNGLRTKPGITNLKKLKRLEIKDLQYLAEVTDVTGVLAFLEMQSLEYLNCGRSLMSTNCLSRLAGKFPDNMVYQSSLNRISPPFRGERFGDENYLRDLRKCSFL